MSFLLNNQVGAQKAALKGRPVDFSIPDTFNNFVTPSGAYGYGAYGAVGDALRSPVGVARRMSVAPEVPQVHTGTLAPAPHCNNFNGQPTGVGTFASTAPVVAKAPSTFLASHKVASPTMHTMVTK